MGWGDPFKAAWSGATGKARKAATAIADGVTSAKDWTTEKAAEAKDWAVRKGREAKEWAVAKGTAAVRGAEKKALQGGEAVAGWIDRGANTVGNAKTSLAAKANSAYNKARSVFGLEPVGQACLTCPGPKQPSTDKEADGWYMGADCKLHKKLEDAKKNRYGPSDKNECCKGKQSDRTIYYVNGINTKRDGHCNTLNEIANSTCANVIGIYNAHENFAKDALQTGGDRQLINRAAAGRPPRLDGRNPAVNTVSNTVYSEIQASRRLEIWAHSQGGAVTSLGLYSADNRLQMAGNESRLASVKVTSMGSAAPRWVDGPAYEHYVHANDITPVSLGLGDDAASAAKRAGKGAKIYRFSGDAASGFPDEGAAGVKKGMLTPTSNHGVEETYIAKRESVHGGCGKSFKAQGKT